MNVLKKEATRKKFEYCNNLKYYINIKKGINNHDF